MNPDEHLQFTQLEAEVERLERELARRAAPVFPAAGCTISRDAEGFLDVSFQVGPQLLTIRDDAVAWGRFRAALGRLLDSEQVVL